MDTGFEIESENVSRSRVNSDHPAEKNGNLDNISGITPSKLSVNKQQQQQQQQQQQNVTARARRRREEAVRRLVADVQARPDRKLTTNSGIGVNINGDASTKESQDWIIASSVAASLERGLDRELHHELVQEAKENAGRIGQVCHDHSDLFLASVGKVVALGNPASDLAVKLSTAQDELEQKTSLPMQQAAMLWEEATDSHARARALYIMVLEFQKVAIYLEKAKKQAALGRPRGALEAVDDARNILTAPISSLFSSGGPQLERVSQILKDAASERKSDHKNNEDGNAGLGGAPPESRSTNKGIETLQETPFGKRASLMLPKIENEVLIGAKRGLNRWFLSLRSGGDGAKAGRAVLRRCAHSMAAGPGNIGLGGHMPPAYIWRAKICDNLISRMNQNGRVVRSVRLGYWFERDAPKDAQRLENNSPPGMERRAEAFASAFGWYRCWDENISLLVDPSDFSSAPDDMGRGLGGSRHGLGGSRHGKRGSLGFRAKSGKGGIETMTSSLTSSGAGPKQNSRDKEKSKWATLLTPSLLFDNSPTR